MVDPGWVEIPILQGYISTHLAGLGQDNLNTYDEGELKKGLEYANKALLIDPDNPKALELKGIIMNYMASVQGAVNKKTLYNEAEKVLKLAVSTDNLRAREWYELSDIYRRKGNFIEAKNAAVNALNADAFLSNSLYIIYFLASVSVDPEEYDDAIRWIEEGIRNYPAEPSFPALKLNIQSLPQGPAPDLEEAWKINYQVCEIISVD